MAVLSSPRAQSAAAQAANLASAENGYLPVIELPMALNAAAAAQEALGDREAALESLQQAAMHMKNVPDVDQETIDAAMESLGKLVERDLKQYGGKASRSILDKMDGGVKKEEL